MKFLSWFLQWWKRESHESVLRLPTQRLNISVPSYQEIVDKYDDLIEKAKQAGNENRVRWLMNAREDELRLV